MWRRLIDELGLMAVEAAAEEAIAAAEAMVGCRLPNSLRGLLQETNGVVGPYQLDVVMSAERIARENRTLRTSDTFREIYMPFDPLLVFGDAGNGDLFFFPIADGKARDREIFVWNHEDDARQPVAMDLERYLRGDLWKW